LKEQSAFEVPEEKIATEIDNRLKFLSQTTKIQGFRPGNIPIKIIQQRFGARVRQEVIEEVIQPSFKVNTIEEAVLPEPNEDFFTQFNTKENSLGAFRKQIREHMERESNQVELPNVMVEQEKVIVKQQVESNSKGSGP